MIKKSYRPGLPEVENIMGLVWTVPEREAHLWASCIPTYQPFVPHATLNCLSH